MRVSMELTVSRQTALNLTVNRQKCGVILTVKTFQGFSNLGISANLHRLLAPEESLNWIITRGVFSETLFEH